MAQEHFDEKAESWDDDPDKARQSAEVARGVTAAVRPTVGARVLEYGAGTGLVTQALLEDTPGLSVTLADNSSGMREAIQRKVDGGALPDGTRVWDLDLENQPLPEERFDLIVSSMVMHHVRQLDVVLRAFAGLLAPGGHLCIADLDKEDGSFHDHDFDGHHGFDRAELTGSLEEAGFTDVSVGDCGHIVREHEDATYGVFLAAARTPTA